MVTNKWKYKTILHWLVSNGKALEDGELISDKSNRKRQHNVYGKGKYSGTWQI